MSIPTHVANHIEAIHVGDTNYALNAALFNGHDWSEVTELVSTGFSAKVYETLPVVPTSSQTDKDNFYKEHQGELALVADAQAAAGTYIEYVLVKSGTSPAFDYAWEAIGSTQMDLSNYVQKGTITLTGQTGQAGAETVSTSSDGAQIASGAITINYEKATLAESAGAHTHPVTTAAHSHGVNIIDTPITYVTGIEGGTVLDHTHTYDKASLNGTTVFVTSATGTFLSGATVSTLGVLSWNTDSVATTTAAVSITYTSTNSSSAGAHNITATTATFSNITSITLNTAQPTGEATSAGAHTHTITATTETINKDISVAVSSHTHSVTTSNHTHSVSASGNNY